MTTQSLPAEPLDPYAGQGGSYLLDPVTGLRTCREAPTAPPESADATTAAAVPGQIGERPDDAEPGVQIDGQGLPPAAEAAQG